MPFKSKSQWHKFFAMANRGEISEGKAKEWAEETKTPFKSLPEKKKEKAEKKSAADVSRAAQIAEGTPMEKKEHGVGTAAARQIATDHVDEHPGKDVYGELKKVDAKLEKKEASQVDNFEKVRALLAKAAEGLMPEQEDGVTGSMGPGAAAPGIWSQLAQALGGAGESIKGMASKGLGFAKSLPGKFEAMPGWQKGLAGAGVGGAGVLGGVGLYSLIRHILANRAEKEGAAHDLPCGGFADGFLSYCIDNKLTDDQTLELLEKGAALEGPAGEELVDLAGQLAKVGMQKAAETK